MKINQVIERAVYAAVIVLALMVLLLIALSPGEFLSINSVYQGF